MIVGLVTVYAAIDTSGAAGDSAIATAGFCHSERIRIQVEHGGYGCGSSDCNRARSRPGTATARPSAKG